MLIYIVVIVMLVCIILVCGTGVYKSYKTFIGNIYGKKDIVQFILDICVFIISFAMVLGTIVTMLINMV